MPMARFNHPLDHVRVAAPCQADWDQMIGSERMRFCGQCSLNVYNLSHMTRADAESLIAQNEGRLCVRFYRRADGSIITKECPVGLKAIRRRVAHVARAISSMVLGLFAGLGVHEAFTSIAPFQERTMGVIVRSTDSPPKVVEPGVKFQGQLTRQNPVTIGRLRRPPTRSK